MSEGGEQEARDRQCESGIVKVDLNWSRRALIQRRAEEWTLKNADGSHPLWSEQQPEKSPEARCMQREDNNAMKSRTTDKGRESEKRTNRTIETGHGPTCC